jgi:hypothetical protein
VIGDIAIYRVLAERCHCSALRPLVVNRVCGKRYVPFFYVLRASGAILTSSPQSQEMPAPAGLFPRRDRLTHLSTSSIIQA